MDLSISLDGIVVICLTFLLGKAIHSIYLYHALQKRNEESEPTEEEEG